MLGRLTRSAPFTPLSYGIAMTVAAAFAIAAPLAQNVGSFGQDVRPGMYAPSEEPSGQEPTGEEPPVEEPTDIGEPQSALGKAIIAKYGEAVFVGNPDAGFHNPDDFVGELGRVQEPMRGDMVYVPWSVELKVDDVFAIEAGGETFWFAVDTSRVLDGRTVLQILMPDDEPDTDPDTGKAPLTDFKGATAQEALDAAGAAWQNNGMPLSGDIQNDLNTYGVTLTATTAAEVTITFDGGQYKLKRLGDRGIYFIM